MPNEIPVLSTRSVSDVIAFEASQRNISIDILSFIETVPLENVDVQQEIEYAFTLSATVVFTSMNAVEAVANFIEAQPPAWNIYCIGNTTRELVERYFGDLIAGTADDAGSLAELIIAEGVDDEVLFFCGSIRRDELPSMLRGEGIDVTEIVVYETIPVPHKVFKRYLGILFFSPSAVESFFSVNKVADDCVLFAIGKTTAESIRRNSNNKIIVSDHPDKESLAMKMLDYFGG